MAGFVATPSSAAGTTQAAREHAQKLAGEHGLAMVGPFRQLATVEGWRSCAAQKYDAVPGLDTIYVPVQIGGGLRQHRRPRPAGSRRSVVRGVADGAPCCALSFDANRAGAVRRHLRRRRRLPAPGSRSGRGPSVRRQAGCVRVDKIGRRRHDPDVCRRPQSRRTVRIVHAGRLLHPDDRADRPCAWRWSPPHRSSSPSSIPSSPRTRREGPPVTLSISATINQLTRLPRRSTHDARPGAVLPR